MAKKAKQIIGVEVIPEAIENAKEKGVDIRFNTNKEVGTPMNKVFKEMFNGLDVSPKQGFLVTMWNMDMPNPTPQMQPKLMEMVTNTDDKILLRGITLKAMGIVAYDNKDYGMTLHLKNRNIVKCILHMYDRGIDIEYDEFTK